MRIIAGELGGRRIVAPHGTATRPTSDRVREALFSILGPAPADASVLDLFAGSGGLGLEALSRGAARAVFIDSGKPAISALRANITALSLVDRAVVLAARLPAALRHKRLGEMQFDWIFIDAPYSSPDRESTLVALSKTELARVGAIVSVEHDRRRPPDHEVGCLVRTDRRRYGDTEISFYRRGTP